MTNRTRGTTQQSKVTTGQHSLDKYKTKNSLASPKYRMSGSFHPIKNSQKKPNNEAKLKDALIKGVSAVELWKLVNKDGDVINPK